MPRFQTIFIALVLTTLVGCAPTPRGGRPGPEDPDAPKEFTTTESGLKYKILRRGNGEKPKPMSFVTVDYAGWLDSGEEFDSSYNRREPTKFNLSSVIAGWTEGLQLVSEGGMIELKIPSELGYGPAGMPGSIPPNATLHFKVELHDVRGG
ncbi:FKBP-type peptidyl-prolyl cis-trans isomerase [Rhodopirellula sallentina]|uniref:Peptidyl-prolyl cis-trans isomerase n=1 Tax=Rhodopirellula sallentina SM41 TaxID=1263870 RepID=M5UFC5_9BACT|nr:FKBP-type peptidyl-prolyl cis-trans isomerase [Rhodopirellula sallentina]EMI56551.1 Peptidyl-prolyl cis-trans isomerase, FKBP-type domain protein [Rhodopirellula sallentina SM41]